MFRLAEYRNMIALVVMTPIKMDGQIPRTSLQLIHMVQPMLFLWSPPNGMTLMTMALEIDWKVSKAMPVLRNSVIQQWTDMVVWTPMETSGPIPQTIFFLTR